MRQIADVIETDGPNQILRENGKRRVVVLANTDGSADMAAVIADIRRDHGGIEAAARASSPASKARSRRRKSRCAPSACLSLVSLAMIFAILYSRYRSVLFVAHHHGAACRWR